MFGLLWLDELCGIVEILYVGNCCCRLWCCGDLFWEFGVCVCCYKFVWVLWNVCLILNCVWLLLDWKFFLCSCGCMCRCVVLVFFRICMVCCCCLWWVVWMVLCLFFWFVCGLILLMIYVWLVYVLCCVGFCRIFFSLSVVGCGICFLWFWFCWLGNGCIDCWLMIWCYLGRFVDLGCCCFGLWIWSCDSCLCVWCGVLRNLDVLGWSRCFVGCCVVVLIGVCCCVWRFRYDMDIGRIFWLSCCCWVWFLCFCVDIGCRLCGLCCWMYVLLLCFGCWYVLCDSCWLFWFGFCGWCRFMYDCRFVLFLVWRLWDWYRGVCVCCWGVLVWLVFCW